MTVFVVEALLEADLVMDGDSRSLELMWIRVKFPNKSMFIGVTPGPIYDRVVMLDILENTLGQTDPRVLIFHAGYFNLLREEEIVERTEIIPMIHAPTSA